jgi:serine/threonine protein kinase
LLFVPLPREPGMTDPVTTTNNNKQQSLEALCFGGAHVTALASRHLTVVARGTFGEVSLAFWSAAESTAAAAADPPQQQQRQRRRQVVAVKTIAQAWTRLGALAPAVHAEITALRCLAGEATIVSLRAVVVVGANSGNSISLVLDYAPVDLGEVLEAKRRSGAPLLSSAVVASLTGDLIQALGHTHARGIVHRDVKPGNLLVCARTGRLQLCDFGLAYFVATDDDEAARTASAATALGTLYYRPPEVLLGLRAVRASVDVYAAGLVLAELLTGRPLWAGTNDLSQLQLIFGGLGTPTKESWPTVSDLPDWSKVRFAAQACPSWTTLVPRAASLPWATALLARLVQLDPGQRCTAAQAGQLLSSSRPSSDAWDDVVRECIPLALLPPLCLSDDSKLDWPVERLVATAQARRTFLSTLEAQLPQHAW